MKLSKYIIKEEKVYDIKRMNVTAENGVTIGNVTPLNGCQRIEFRLSGTEILARRHSHSHTYYDIIKEGMVIGRFFKSGAFRSDIEINQKGRIVQFSIFSTADYRTAKILSNGIEIGLLSTKRNFFSVEHGLVITGDEHIDLLLASMLIHILYEKNIVVHSENIFI